MGLKIGSIACRSSEAARPSQKNARAISAVEQAGEFRVPRAPWIPRATGRPSRIHDEDHGQLAHASV
jgi:hypothetical protein